MSPATVDHDFASLSPTSSPPGGAPPEPGSWDGSNSSLLGGVSAADFAAGSVVFGRRPFLPAADLAAGELRAVLRFPFCPAADFAFGRFGPWSPMRRWYASEAYVPSSRIRACRAINPISSSAARWPRTV